MIQFKIFFLIIFFIFGQQNVKAEIDFEARYMIIQDYLSGEILFEKDADRSIYPASDKNNDLDSSF